MHPNVFLKNRIRQSNEPGIAFDSEAFRYGNGVFTTIRIKEKMPVLWERHFKRLTSSAAALDIDFPWEESVLRKALEEVVEANDCLHARARISVLGTGGTFVEGTSRGAQFLVETSDLPSRPGRYRIGVSGYPVNSQSPTTGLKTLNYLDQLLAFRVVKSKGEDEAIRINERGFVVSGCLSNVFWRKHDKLFTPSLKTGCLAGTTRDEILSRVAVEEVEAGLETLEAADQIFLTSSVIGVKPVLYFNQQELSSVAIPDNLEEINNLFLSNGTAAG